MKIKYCSLIILLLTLSSFNLFGAASDQVSAEPDDYETSQEIGRAHV